MQFTTPQEVLQAYMDGSRDLDRAKLTRCFHPKSILTGYLKGQAIVGTPELFLNDIDRMVAAGVRNTGYQAKIDSLTVTGSVASATVVMSGLAGLDFEDYMHLVEENGRWSIISKLFTTV
jgi:Putative lumazine-binding